MFNEKAFIAQVEAADTKELAELLRQPTREEEEALRTHLGPERYQRMHSMALKRNVSRSLARSRGQSAERGNVVAIHGIMGGELTATDRKGSSDQIWVKALKIMNGWLGRLRLGDDGRSEYDERYDVRASGIMKRYYGELLLSLSEKWNVRAFWFDWRKDLKLAATDLEAQIDGWFKDGEPVHLVAHSMGGLVARTFIKKYPERWKSMWDEKENGRRGGRLVMLGTPNYGSFAIPQTVTGIESMVRKLALLDIRHSRTELLEILNSFVGSYQMLPSPQVMPEMQPLYNAGTYTGANVPQRHLDNALAHHQYLSDVVDEARMIYVAGYGQPTFSSIRDFKKIGTIEAYDVTLDGDGRVPHALGLLRRNGRQVGPVYYIKEEHGNLSSNAKILDALTELLETGATGRLEKELPARRGAEKRSARNLRQQAQDKAKEDERQLEISLRRMRLGRASLASRSGDARFSRDEEGSAELATTRVSPEERKVEETLTREYLGSRGDEQWLSPMSDVEEAGGDLSIESTRIEIGLVHGAIESTELYAELQKSGGAPVDAIAVGHYIGVQPQAAELQLDRAISAALPGKVAGAGDEISKSDLILTQYTERGIIHGKLGQPFFLPDPRPNTSGRIIAIAGMDEPGRFGVPELTVLVRELCWSLGRMGKRHMATVVIGIGVGNLNLTDAISAWMNGVRRAVTGSRDDDQRRLQRITIVEFDPRKVPAIQDVILREQERQRKHGLEIVYTPLTSEQLAKVERAAFETARAELERNLKGWQTKQSELESPVPSRLTLGLDMTRKAYRFGAITDSASLPEREIRIDPQVIMQANDELAGEQNPAMQLERGRFLEELLMPDDLRRQLYNNAPVVMMLDSTTARIHWEMVAQPELIAATGGVAVAHEDNEFKADRFLGTSRGFTRQLRTTFAPPPEPPPPPRRVLRVLVVADPAEDAHLPGAQEEGAAVADIFESYNTVYSDRLEDTRVEVVRLFGPVEATRTNVLRELMVRQYDLLHYAGHCEYNVKDPSSSGWIFNMQKNERLSANELNRIDRIPKFVFSNACESGITPDRSRERTAELAPSFAEAFFMRGVANFVCTAWPVDDLAARVFSLTLYGWLLGIQVGEDGSYSRGTPKPMHYAMREGRIAIANMEEGVSTWGAYQHYGNPYFQLFNPTDKAEDEGGKSKTQRKAAPGSKKTGSRKAGKSSSKAGRKKSRR
ncbi:MAG: CHAT domain-containing protein [Pyrinomonadaceae bacterium]|nr:CHAT domain-containing protein [Pyrinomonadaceae bacterium]